MGSGWMERFFASDLGDSRDFRLFAGFFEEIEVGRIGRSIKPSRVCRFDAKAGEAMQRIAKKPCLRNAPQSGDGRTTSGGPFLHKDGLGLAQRCECVAGFRGGPGCMLLSASRSSERNAPA